MTIKTVLMDPYTPLHVYSPILPTAKVQLPSWTVETALKKMSAFFRLGLMLLVEDVPRGIPIPVATTPPIVPATGTGTVSGGSGGAGTGSGSGSGSGSATPPLPPTPTPTPAPGPVPAGGSGGSGAGGAAGAPGTTTPAGGTDTGTGTGTGTGTTPAPPKEHIVRLPISGRKGTWKWLQPYDTQPDKVAHAEFAEYPVEEDQGQVKFAPGPYTFVEGYLLLAGQTFAGLNQGGNAA